MRTTPLAAMIAAGFLLAGLAGCGTRSATDAASAPPGTAGGTATFIAGPGLDAPGAAVPWAAVGPGWALVEADAGPDSLSLFLIDPPGGRYTLFTWPADGPGPGGLLFDWSGDKRRALFWGPPSRTDKDGVGTWYQLDLRTGKSARLPLAKNDNVIGYTRPSGDQLLTQAILTPDFATSTVELIDLHGHVTRKLYTGESSGQPFSSPDGTSYVLSEQVKGQVLVSATGKVLRPVGSKEADNCSVLRWWDATSLLMACEVYSTPSDNGNSRIWLAPASGTASTALTPLRTQGRASADWGDYDYVRLASGDYVEAIGPNCGNHLLARLGPHGKAIVVKVPGATDVKIEAATATRLLLLIQGGSCGGLTHPQSLIWLDPKTGAEAPAVPTGKGEAEVLGVVPYYDEGPH